ncbi:hypothetical protein [Mucilaginibacter sp. UR6-11]|uniref:hypothetical protein n=1 Tax=Mucilaginibacter sp. UR6-11 TaxID=1435644 RepID=UPI001E62DFD2|nr:hypothetical protein [Mucilaginibacter sp. UR6-11]MCC8426446.1 hypothetical protein [Mucilaginibacter sp. UR6-11]
MHINLFNPIKCLIFLFLSMLLVTGCKDKTEKKVTRKTVRVTRQENRPKVSPDTAAIDPAKLGCLLTTYRYSYDPQTFSPGTFNKITYVYNAIKGTAKVIDSLPFNTPVNILKEYRDYFLVCTPKLKSGYIKKPDLYFQSFYGGEDTSYLVGIAKYPPHLSEVDDDVTCEPGIVKFIKTGKSQKILNTYTDTIEGAHYQINKLSSSALKNSVGIFHLTYSCMHDIEDDMDLFVIDNGKKLSRLFLAGGSGDGGYYDDTRIYLPIQVTNGKKIVLAKNGVLSVDDTKPQLEIFLYPKDCGIAIDELIVVQSIQVEPVGDDKPKYNNDGTEAENLTIEFTKYFRWDGNKLKLIRTIKGK